MKDSEFIKEFEDNIRDSDVHSLKFMISLIDKEIENKTVEKLTIFPIEDVRELAFDVVTDVYITKEGRKNFTRRKVIFLHHLRKYFDVVPKKEVEI